MFKTDFGQFVCEGDTIEARPSAGKWSTGLRFVATVYRDDSGETPEQRDMGFWPSLDPQSCGYIGPKSKATLARHMRKAQAVLAAWQAEDWFYCGVAVRAFFDDIPLTGEYGHALWGIECNYPGKRANSYLREVANELLDDCAHEAIAKLTEIFEAGAESIAAWSLSRHGSPCRALDDVRTRKETT